MNTLEKNNLIADLENNAELIDLAIQYLEHKARKQEFNIGSDTGLKAIIVAVAYNIAQHAKIEFIAD